MLKLVAKEVNAFSAAVGKTTGIRRSLSSTLINKQDYDPSINPLRSYNNHKLGLEFSKHFKMNPNDSKIDDATILDNNSIRDQALGSKFGVKPGRTVTVFNNDTATACKRLNSVVFANQIAMDRRSQRFHMKPGKKAELKRSQRHRRDFMKGFKRLMDIVKDAKRKGY